MPKGDIVGIFIGILCLSLMERTTTKIVCLQTGNTTMRKETMMENRESISSEEEANNMKIKA
jgi:hypothetical protein